MNREQALQEIVELYSEVRFEEHFSIEIELTNNEIYDIQSSNNFIGNDNNIGFMSGMLGNIIYNNIKEIANDILDIIEDNNYCIKEISVNS